MNITVEFGTVKTIGDRDFARAFCSGSKISETSSCKQASDSGLGVLALAYSGVYADASR
ncbi:hypothetical protein JCM19231_3234 [Vibrio ishigakensis]|uniref:Uncharacterized protein n=1 Tax=Vibrio ishigakensis TaxID=1481914 RepID=A0A0B8P1B4_9VIBR|nr:hypothetical protein JCM19231_3234 [Vibrio ishigakensis]